jgi:hypothetical protein
MSLGVPPSNVQAEQQVLGALLDPLREVYSEVSRILLAEHFADPVHGFLYGKIVERIVAGYPEWQLIIEADSNQITPDMDQQLEEMGGRRYIQQLLDSYRLDPAPVAPLAEMIAKAYRSRALIDVGDEIRNRAEHLISSAFVGRGSEESLLDARAALDRVVSACRQMAGADVQFVDGHVVDMRHPDDRLQPDMSLDSDIYGQPMLLTTSLDREEVLMLSEFHHAASKRAVVLVRTAERDHHRKRGTLFSDALLELDPMDPSLPGCPDAMPWEIG